jgi:hypothetical protein
MRTQLLVAEYLQSLYPHALSAGAGRPGKDVLNTPGLSVEVKARTNLDPLAWVKQAEGHEGLPVAVFRPNGMGEHPEQFVAFLRFGDFVNLLKAAGYGER